MNASIVSDMLRLAAMFLLEIFDSLYTSDQYESRGHRTKTESIRRLQVAVMSFCKQPTAREQKRCGA